MLMQPTSPDPKFDFMLKNNQQTKRRLPLPTLPRPAKIILTVVAVIFLLILASSLLSGRGGGGTKDIISAMARGQETLRVTQIIQPQLQDPSAQALAATASSSLASDQQQLKAYLATNHTKIGTAQLAADTDKTTDASLQTALQNNNLDTAYVAYLKTSLNEYQTSLQTAYSSAGTKGKVILKAAFDSTGTLLASPQLK